MAGETPAMKYRVAEIYSFENCFVTLLPEFIHLMDNWYTPFTSLPTPSMVKELFPLDNCSCWRRTCAPTELKTEITALSVVVFTIFKYRFPLTGFVKMTIDEVLLFRLTNIVLL